MDISEICDEVASITQDEFLESLKEIEVSFTQVVNDMKLFINAVNDYNTQLDINNNIINQKQNIKNIESFNLEQQENKKKLQIFEENIYKTLFDFQNSFNLYYKQYIQMIFVTPEGELKLVDNTVGELTRNDKYQKLQYLDSQIKGITLTNSKDFNPAGLFKTYNESIYRWSVAASVHTRKTFLPIMWKNGGDWQWVFVNNTGTLAEAYVNFYLHKEEINPGGTDPNVAEFVTNTNYGAASVDNARGFGRGDVEIRTNMYNVLFGVKKDMASPLGWKQLYKDIINITNGLETVNEEVLDKIKEKVSSDGAKNQVKNTTKNFIQSEIDKLIEIFNNK